MVQVNPTVRLPRNYDRFVGLFEQLLLRGQVPPDGEPLLRVRNDSLPQLLSQLRDSNTQSISMLCVEGGTQTTINGLKSIFPEDGAVPTILGVGAFPHGDLSNEVKALFQTHIELDPDVMMAWHVCAEVLWVYSLKMEVVKARYTS
jgi:rRNA small subunit pseudouridine methyltransferase Nep1